MYPVEMFVKVMEQCPICWVGLILVSVSFVVFIKKVT